MPKQEEIESVAQLISGRVEDVKGFTYEMLKSTQHSAKEVSFHLRHAKAAVLGGIALQFAALDIPYLDTNELALSINERRLPFTVAFGMAAMLHARIQYLNAQHHRNDSDWYKSIESVVAPEVGHSNVDLVIDRAIEMKKEDMHGSAL